MFIETDIKREKEGTQRGGAGRFPEEKGHPFQVVLQVFFGLMIS